MDGTLVDSLAFWSVLWKKIGKRYLGEENFVPEEEVDRRVRTMIFVDALEYVWTHYGFRCSCEEFVAFGTDGITEFYREYAKPKAGAVAFLNHLKQSGVRLCLATATDPKYIADALTLCGMTGYFDTVLSCVEVGYGKDRPQIYLEALARLDCFPDESCVLALIKLHAVVATAITRSSVIGTDVVPFRRALFFPIPQYLFSHFGIGKA